MSCSAKYNNSIESVKQKIKETNTKEKIEYKKICEYCKNEFTFQVCIPISEKTQKQIDKRRFCNTSCSAKWRNLHLDKTKIFSDDFKRKISESQKLNYQKNPERRKISSETMKKTNAKYNFHTDEILKKQSETIKNKILTGKWTPNITNSWCHGTTDYIIDDQTYKFRSSWEAVFFILNKDNKNLYYELIRIPYEYKNDVHTYIIDFVDKQNKKIYEIGPKSKLNHEKNKIKFEYANKWAIENGYEFEIINENWFYKNAKNVDYNQFPELKNKMKQFLEK